MGGYLSSGSFASASWMEIPIGIGDSLGAIQNLHAYNRDEIWSKRGYNMELQGMRIDILNTIREEMRDQVSLTIASLDNMMLVSTLMLSVSFGFVVEGTFPPTENDVVPYTDLQVFWLHVYIVLCAVAMVFPAITMMLTLVIRQEVDSCTHGVLGDLQRHLMMAVRRAADEDFDTGVPADAIADAAEAGAESEPELLSARARPSAVARRSVAARGQGTARPRPHGMRSRAQGLKDIAATQLGTMVSSDEGRLGKITEKDLIAEGLDIRTMKRFFPYAQLSLQLGILSFLLLCAVLLGLNMQYMFPSVPDMWIYYSIPVTISTICAVPFIFELSGTNSTVLVPQKSRDTRIPLSRRQSLLRLQSDLNQSIRRRDSNMSSPQPQRTLLSALPLPSRSASADLHRPAASMTLHRSVSVPPSQGTRLTSVREGFPPRTSVRPPVTAIRQPRLAHPRR